MSNKGWAIAFILSFIPLGLWISFLLFKVGMNFSAFPWVTFAIPAVPYMGLQVCLAIPAFGERIRGGAERLRLAIPAFAERVRGEAERLRLAILAFGTAMARKPIMKKCANSMILGVKSFTGYLSIRPYLAMFARSRRRQA